MQDRQCKKATAGLSTRFDEKGEVGGLFSLSTISPSLSLISSRPRLSNKIHKKKEGCYRSKGYRGYKYLTDLENLSLRVT